MNLKNKQVWEEIINSNQDNEQVQPLLKMTEAVMRILDVYPNPLNQQVCMGIIRECSQSLGIDNVDSKMVLGITNIVYECHQRGEEFKKVI